MTSTAGGPDGRLSISKAGCLRQMPSSCRKEAEARDLLPPASAFGRGCWKNVVARRNHPVNRISTTASKKTENTRSAYPLEFIPNASRSGPRPLIRRNLVMAGGGCIRRDAADREIDAGRQGDVPLPVRLTNRERWRAPSGAWAKETAAGILDLLRLALPAARPFGLRQSAGAT